MDTFVRFVSHILAVGDAFASQQEHQVPAAQTASVGPCGKAAGYGGAPISWGGGMSGTGMRLRKGRADPADPAPSLIAVA